MHVKAKQMAFLGLLAAFVSLLVVFASVLESNTFFLLAAGAYCTGIAIREFGLRLGTGFSIACMLLGLILSPNKIYALTFAGLSFYIVFFEGAHLFFARARFEAHRRVLFFISKLLVFNLLYIPMLLLFPKVIFAGSISTTVLFSLLATGQIGWLIYDKAYPYFQIMVWGKLRGKIHLLR